jgi:tRNA A-37 threonylcarbamoyl transferase component Bud32
MAQQVLGERYKIEGTLGEGGMARVYRGTDEVLGRTVAVKVLADRYTRDDRFLTRFRREAQAAAALSHPNIVAVYDTGNDGAAHYIVMEYVEGETLADILRREGPLDPVRAASIAEDVAAALQAAHDRGLVHRDVKPGNVMIDADGRIKVMDFGIARAAAEDTLTQTGAVLGTAAYLSPEQAQGDRVDARTDIYALGCVLYEMVAGRPPFSGDSPVSLAFRHVNEEPQPPSVYHPGVPVEIEAVIMRALEKDPDRRFGSAEELSHALARARAAGVDTEPVAAAAGGDTSVMPTRPATAPVDRPPPGEPRRGVPWVLVAILAAAVLLVAGFLALTNLADRDRAGRGGGQGSGGQQGQQEEEEPPPADELAPGEAMAAFDDLLSTSLTEGTVTLDAGNAIADRMDEAANKYAEGDLEAALGELDAAREEVDKAAEEGEITSEEAFTALHEGIDVVAASMEASPPEVPVEEDEDEGEGEGNGDEDSSEAGNSESAPGKSEDKGKGKDKGKDKD